MARLTSIEGNLYGLGFATDLHTVEGLLFDVNKPYRFCFICGAVWQNARCRKITPYTSDKERLLVQIAGQEWANTHSSFHSGADHNNFAKYGPSYFPEASKKLASFGVINLSQDNETVDALLQSSPIPQNDAEE